MDQLQGLGLKLLAADTKQRSTDIALRRAKVLQLKAKGYTNQDIAEHVGVNEKTVRRDLASEGIISFVGELIRRQLLDIETSHPEDLPVRDKLRWRADLIQKLLPSNISINESETEKIFKLIIEDPSQPGEDNR